MDTLKRIAVSSRVGYDDRSTEQRWAGADVASSEPGRFRSPPCPAHAVRQPPAQRFKLPPAVCRLVEDTCAEAEQMLKLVPLLASPVKGPLFDFMELDVDMVPVTPATCSLQHLAQCALKPAWLADQDRPSGAPPHPHAPIR